MGFIYTKPPLTQGLASFVFLALSIGAMSLPGAEEVWNAYLANTPDWFHFVGMVFLLHGGIYWGMVLFFNYVEKTGSPNFIAKYKIQTKTFKRPTRKRIAWILGWNQLVWTPLILIGIHKSLIFQSLQLLVVHMMIGF